MGIKMKKARLDGNKIKIGDYDKENKSDNLKCYYCDANISYVGSYKRSLGDKEIIVKEHFRLKRDNQHGENCKYDIDGAMVDIIASCADAELMSKQGNMYKVRLMLIAEDDEGLKKTSDSSNNNAYHEKNKPNYICSGKKTAYLSSMKKIMKLRSEVEKDIDLSKKVELQFSDKFGNVKNILWSNFYFEANKEKGYDNLYEYLRTGKVYHNICVDGYIKAIKEVSKEEKIYYILELEPVRINENSSDDERVSVSLFVSDKQIFDLLDGNKERRISIYSNCRFKTSKPWESEEKKGQPTKKILYHQITGNIYNAGQMIFLDD